MLENIENNYYKDDEKLPSENELSVTFEVNRHTIRKALQLLKNDGFIYTVKGKGNFISNVKMPYRITDKSNYSSQIMSLGYEPKTKLLSVDIIEPSLEVSKQLHLAKEAQVIQIKLLRFANDVPMSLSVSYFELKKYAKLLDCLHIEPFSLYKALQLAFTDIEIIKESTVFESILPSLDEANLLQMPLSNPLLKAETLSKNQQGEYLEYGISVFRADMCKIKVDLV